MEKITITFPIHIEVPSMKGPQILTFETFLDFKRNWERYHGWRKEIESYFADRGVIMFDFLHIHGVYNIITGQPAPIKHTPKLHSVYYEIQDQLAEYQKLK